MSPSSILQLAAVLATAQGLAHGALLLTAKPRHGAAEEAVVTAMKSNHFAFGGSMRSYWDFYLGYGLEAAGVCIVEAALLWQLARIAGSYPALVVPSIAVFLLANLAHAALMIRYFFYLPLVFDVIVAGCLAWAFVAARG